MSVAISSSLPPSNDDGSQQDGSDGTTIIPMSYQGTIKRNPCIISQAMPVSTSTRSRGTADITGFGVSGAFSLRNAFDLRVKKIHNDFSHNMGWRVAKHVRLLADTTGDGTLDLVGFGDQAVIIAVNNGDNTFQPAKKAIEEFSYLADVWRVNKHPRFMADLCNTGRADIIGFGNFGVLVSLNRGDGKFSPPRYGLRNDFGYTEGAGGWRLESHLRFLADVTGNGFLDILGFGEDAVFVAEGKGDGTFRPRKAVLRDMCVSQRWQVKYHARFVADLTGNGLPDLIGFFWDGVYVSLNTGTGIGDPQAQGMFTPIQKVSDAFGYDTGWSIDRHLFCIADLTGNGCGDIIAFGEEGVYTSINNGDGTFQQPTLVVRNFCWGEGWRIPQHPRFVSDLTGDGRGDIIGFGYAGVYVSFNDGEGGFGPAKLLVNDFGCNGIEWSNEIAPMYVANVY